MKQRHCAVPSRYDLVQGHIVTTLRNPKPDAFNVRLWVIGANKEKLNEKARGFSANQNIHFAWMRHDSLKAEAAFRLNACFPATISNDLRLSDAFVVGTL